MTPDIIPVRRVPHGTLTFDEPRGPNAFHACKALLDHFDTYSDATVANLISGSAVSAQFLLIQQARTALRVEGYRA